MTSTVPTPTKLTPGALIEQLRSLQSQIGDVTPLSAAQRAQLKGRTRKQPPHITEASINVIGKSPTVAQAVGQPLDDVRQMQIDVLAWDEAAGEMHTFLKAIESANVVRRERLAFIGAQAYSFGSQLAKNPANADLLPQVEEIKKLKSAARRKKTQATPQAPSPVPASPAPTPQPKQ
ncbi:MAG TPA: hypothetical protein VGJ82_12225 [Thermoanaerobaculia bacterium]|jgi:hypothetical protein